MEKAYPGEKISSCKKENGDGKIQYEVKLDKASLNKMEFDVSPAGVILVTEESVKLDSVPKAVVAGFVAKYPNMKAKHAIKQSKLDGTVTYEFAFKDKTKGREATFSDAGIFIEEE